MGASHRAGRSPRTVRCPIVLVDGQFLVSCARAFRDYADSLGKPIDRLYVSHRHPDHWFGLGAAFSDVTIYALPETRDFIQSTEKRRETATGSSVTSFRPR